VDYLDLQFLIGWVMSPFILVPVGICLAVSMLLFITGLFDGAVRPPAA
jgi:hypothetical protein